MRFTILISVLCSFLMCVSVRGQNDSVLMDRLLPIITDTTLVNRKSVELSDALKQIKEVDTSIASKLAPYLPRYIDLDLYIVDTVAFLKMKQAYSSFIPFEYLYPAIDACIYIGEPVLPHILRYILENDINSEYRRNSMLVINKITGSNRAAKAYILAFAESYHADKRKKLIEFAELFPSQ